MKKIFFSGIFFLMAGIIAATDIYKNVEIPDGPYLGQKPPGEKPELFAEGIITTEFHEHSSPAFSPDGNEVYWSVFINFWGPQVILYMKKEDGKWTAPEVAPFNQGYSDGNPCFSPDGKKIFFESRRPLAKGDPFTGNTDIWVVRRKGTGWAEPENLGEVVNSDKWERGPSISRKGTLYFCSMRDGGFGKMDIYRCRLENGVYGKPENLGKMINTDGHEGWPFIAPDESYLIYQSSGGDLMVSFSGDDDTWLTPENLSAKMNFQGGYERFPLLSNDGKYLFFVSNRWLGPRYFEKSPTLEEVTSRARSLSNGLGNVYWVGAGIIKKNRQ